MNINKLIPKIKAILDYSVQRIELTLEKSGNTGEAFRIRVYSDTSRKDFIIKRFTNPEDYQFYLNVLETYKLNHPKVIGTIDLEGELYLLIDFIDDIKQEWEDNDYLKVIDWLVRKDIASKNIIENSDLIPHIQRKTRRLEKIKQRRKENLIQVAQNYPDLFTGTDISTLLDLTDRMIDSLIKNDLTLVHDDFNRKNILITKAGKIFVIDWTSYYIANVGIDLVEILEDSPKRLEDMMISSYIDQTGYNGVLERLVDLRINNHLSHMDWYLERLISGAEEFEDVEDDLRILMENILNFQNW